MIRSISHQTATVVSMWTGRRRSMRYATMTPPSRRKKNAKMGVSATMKAISPKWARSSEALPMRSSMSSNSQPSCRGSFGRNRCVWG